MMTKQEIKRRIEFLEKTLSNFEKDCENLNKEIEMLSNLEKQSQKQDFSQFIKRDDEDLAIKGEKYITSSIVDIIYEKNPVIKFVDKVNYEVVTFEDLKYGDVFIQNDIQNPQLDDFHIFMGKDDNHYYSFIYLEIQHGIESIHTDTYSEQYKIHKVKRFLRR